MERILRDARINQIAEGANEVLKSFISLVGMRAPGRQFQELQESLQHPWGELRKVWLLGLDRIDAVVRAPTVPVRNSGLRVYAGQLGRSIRRFNREVVRALLRYREEILERQYVQERLACAAMELFASACVLSRWDAESKSKSDGQPDNAATGSVPDLFLRASFRRFRAALAELKDNDDLAITRTADRVLGQPGS
jgi:hypothetical protein